MTGPSIWSPTGRPSGKCVRAAICASMLVLGVGVRSGYAQALHEGKITGTVVSEDGVALPGAILEISSAALITGTRSATTSAKGSYVFLNLPVGKYKVTASRDGFRKVTTAEIEISAGGAVTRDLTLPVGTVQETMEVLAEGSIVDTKTSTIDSRIDPEMLAQLPTSRDAFYDLALTAPGMFDSASSNSLPSPSAYGSATNENVFLINGVNATNPRAGSFGSLVNVNYDAVEEVRIVATGSKAEYGSFSGAAIDVQTKSGGNAFHGSAAFYSKLGTPASNQPAPGADLGRPFLFVGEGEQLSGETKKDWEGSATLGGPIVKDKLWFFGAFNYLRGASLPPRWSLENESWGRYADGKISAEPFKKHRAWLSYHYENNDSTGTSWGSEPAWDTTMSYGTATVNHTVSGQWQFFPNNKTTASAKYLGFWTNDKPHLPDQRPDNPGYINWWKWADYGINGAFPYVEAQKSARQTVQADVSHYADNFLGAHDIKFGVQYTKGRGNWQGGYFQNYVNFLYPYRWTQSVHYMQSWYGDTGLLFYNQRDKLNPFLTVRTADSRGVFLDDQWTPIKRLTINLGLRYDGMSTKYGTGKVYDFVTSPDGINGPPPEIRDRASTGNIFDFKNWSPRVGLSYMLTGDGKTMARAAFGRYYQPISVETLRRFGPDMPLTEPDLPDLRGRAVERGRHQRRRGDRHERDAQRGPPGARADSAARGGADRRLLLDPQRRRQPEGPVHRPDHLERGAGDRPRTCRSAATYIYKHSGNLFANIPINRETGQEWEYERIPFTTSGGQQVMLYSIVEKDYNADGVVDSQDIAWIGNHNTSRVQNMPAFDGVKPKRDYHGFQLVLNKRYSERWQGLASLLYSKSSGLSRRSFRQDFNAEGPMFFDDNWMGTLNYTVNNLEGPLPFTPKYEVKVSGSYKIPRLEVDLGVRYRMHTGRAMWRLDDYPSHTQFGSPEGGVIDPGGLPQVLGVDPNNPDYLPSQHILDLHLEKSLNLGASSRKLHLVVDGFNIFNTYAPTDMDPHFEYGKVTAIPTSRRFRGGVRFEF